MKIRSTQLSFVFVLLTGFCVPAFSQNIQNPQSAVDNLMRSSLKVDPSTGAMQLKVPLGAIRGRGGASLPVELNYSSKVWNIKHQSTFPCNGEPVTSYRPEFAKSSASGWTSTLGWFLPSEDLSLETYEGLHGKPAQRGNPQLFRIMRKFVTLPDGSRHEVRKDDALHNLSENTFGMYYAVDGSRLMYDLATSTVFLPDGSRVVDNATGSPQFIDSNGNFMTYSAGTWTDTLGRTFGVPIPGTAPSAAGDIVYNLPGGLTYTLRWRNLANVLTDPTQPLHFPGDSPSGSCTLGFTQPGTLFITQDANNKILKGSTFNPVVLSQISLPNNTNYTFTYNVYGEIDKIVYPTGGTEQFTYGTWEPLGGQLDDGTYSQANRGVNSRVVSDGVTAQVWSYGANGFEPGVDPATDVRLVRSPDGTVTKTWYYISRGTQIKYGFDDARTGMVREVRVYNSTGTMLRRTINQVVRDGPLAGGYQTATRNARVTKTVAIILDTAGDALAATTEMTYDADLNVTSTRQYDFVLISQSTAQTADHTSIPAGTLLRTTETDYLTGDVDYRARNLLSLPTATRVKNGEGTIVAQGAISYDELSFSLLPCETVTGWSDPDANARGNATTTSNWLNTTGENLQTHVQYDQCGNPRRIWDARDTSLTNPTQIDYSPIYHCAYPTTNTSADPDRAGPLSALVTRAVYDSATGLITSTTDANNQTTSYSYTDPLLRLKQVIRASTDTTAKNQTTYNYDDSARTITVTSDLNGFNDNLLKMMTAFDTLGRPVENRTYEGGTNYIATQTQYDEMGRAYKTSNPFRPLQESAAWTTTVFDALGRVTSVKTPDNAVVTTSYSGNIITVTDQAGKARKSVIDALGRLTDVFEDPTPGLNYQTTYAYDTLDNLVKVTQGSQQRFFMYDSLKRLIRTRNPEQGTLASLNLSDPITENSTWSMGYEYDSIGNLTQKTDARGVVSTYVYDELNRNTTIDYSNTPSVNPDVTRTYDGAVNGKGRFWKSYSGGTETEGTNIERTVVDSYDALGRPLAQQQSFKLNNVWKDYPISRTYNLAGGVVTQTYPSSRTVSYSYDSAGRTSNFSGNLGDSTQRSYASGITYSQWGSQAREQFGTNTPLYHKAFYNIRGQLFDTRLSSVNDTSDWNRGRLVLYYSGNHQWGESGTDNNGNVRFAENWIPPENAALDQADTLFEETYTYDTLNRLTSVAEQRMSVATGWGNWQQQFRQQYTYDRWGNRTIDAAQTWGAGINNKQFAVDAATNRLGVPNGQNGTMSYDDAGNLIDDTYTGAGAREYDAENKITRAWGGNSQWQEYTYNADGQRTRRKVDGQETWQVYGMDGELLAEYAANGSLNSPQKEYGYRNGELLITAVPAQITRKNFALRANGGSASASSEISSGCSIWPARGAIDGDRKGSNWGTNGGWADSSSGTFSNDWFQVDFDSAKTIDELDIFTLQDNPNNPSEPTETMTFTTYGLTAYSVSYWNGSAWINIPEASVVGNNKVWRKFTFSPITTTKIRVLPQGAIDNGFSRLTEVEAWGNVTAPAKTNVALRSNGAVATASSEISWECDTWPARGANDGDRKGAYWGNTGGWADASSGNFSNDWLQIDFAGSKTIDEIDVFTIQDNYANPVEPTETTTFSTYGLTAFDVSYWNGTNWVQIPETVVTGNNKVWRKFTFSAITTTKIRVYGRAAVDNGFSRIAEVEVWSPSESSGGGGIEWLVSDHLGTPRMVIDQTGSLAAIRRHDYLPFGEELNSQQGLRPAGLGYFSDNVRQQFTAKERDVETGLDYFLARYYSNLQGRFSSPDEFKNGPREVGMLGSGDPEKQALVYAEVTNPQSLNKYQYAFNNPLRYVDPDGQNPQDGHELRLRRDEKALVEGRLSPEEFMARRKAEAAGAVVGLATLAALRGGVPVAIAIWRWATQNPDKVQQLGVELSQASTGSPVSGPPGLTVSAGTRLTASEISTGVRLAEQAGLRLSQSSHLGAEFVSAAGKTYDAMGSVTAYASKNWGNGSQFFKSILKHVHKSVDYVAIDLAGASKSQIQAIEKYVSGLTKEQQAKIIYVR